MYGYPAPMYYQPPALPRTPQGLKWTLVAFAIYLAYAISSVIVGIYLYYVFASLDPADFFSFFNALAALALGAILLVILGIITLVFYFIGFGYLYGGRNEYGPTHARNLRLALPFVIIAPILDLSGRIVSYIITSSAIRIDFFGGGITFDPNALYVGATVSTAVGIVVAAMVAAVLVLAVRAIARPGHNAVLYVAAGIGTATPGIAGALALLSLPRLVATIEEFIASQQGFFSFPIPTDPSLGIPTVVTGALGLLVAVLFFLVYRGASERIRTEELKPVLPPATPAMPWMPPYAGGPPPPPAPVAPPVQTPPTQPPG